MWWVTGRERLLVGDWERERPCVVGDCGERPCVVTGRERERVLKLSLTFLLLGCFSREKVTPAQDGQHK